MQMMVRVKLKRAALNLRIEFKFLDLFELFLTIEDEHPNQKLEFLIYFVGAV